MNFLYLILSVLLVISFCECKRKTPTIQRSGCKINFPQDIPENEPLYLLQSGQRYTFFNPVGQNNLIRVNQKLTLFCPGNRNSLSDVPGNMNITEATCLSSGKFDINGDSYDFNKLNCTKENSGDIRTTREICAGGNGNINEIGFKVSPRLFLPLFHVCYNNGTSSVIYTRHHINGKAIKFNVREAERRDFKSTGVPNQTKPSNSYKKTKQLTHFNDILGATQTYFNNTSFLSRGHMTPDADFIYTTGQFATYFFVNVAPQFQDINAGNWLKVEVMARNLSAQYNTSMLIYTGSYQQLELPNSNGYSVPLWMESNNKIEVPKWLWKVIINEENNSGIVMITLNNPFARKSDIVEFCTNVCRQAGLDSNQFDRMNKGYTFCCEIDDFKRSIDVLLPDEVRAQNLLGCNGINFYRK